MTDRYTEFLSKLADLMDEYEVTFAAREEYHGYSCMVDGIDIEFEQQHVEGYFDRTDYGYKCYEIKVGTLNITGNNIRKLVDGE